MGPEGLRHPQRLGDLGVTCTKRSLEYVDPTEDVGVECRVFDQ